MSGSVFGSLGLSKDRSKSKTNSQSNETATTTLAPELQSTLYGNVQRSAGLADSYTPYTGERVAGFNSDQLAAQAGARDIYYGQVGAGTLGQAIGLAQSAGAYTPQTVTAGSVGNTDLSGYMDPYIGAVVDRTTADLDRARQIENLQNDARASQAGSFGGTGAEVARSLTNDNVARAVASQSASLRSQGFQNAQATATSDLNRQLSAAQGNQSAGLQAAQHQLSSAGMLGQLSDQQLSQAASRLGLLSTSGDAQQALGQRQLDASYEQWRQELENRINLQNLLNSSVGLIPQYGTQNTSSMGTQTTTGTRIGAEGKVDFKIA